MLVYLVDHKANINKKNENCETLCDNYKIINFKKVC